MYLRSFERLRLRLCNAPSCLDHKQLANPQVLEFSAARRIRTLGKHGRHPRGYSSKPDYLHSAYLIQWLRSLCPVTKLTSANTEPIKTLHGTKRTRATAANVGRALSWTLLVVGAISLAYAAYVISDRAVYQQAEIHKFESPTASSNSGFVTQQVRRHTARVLIPQLLSFLRLAHVHAPVLRLPGVDGVLRHSQLPRHVLRPAVG